MRWQSAYRIDSKFLSPKRHNRGKTQWTIKILYTAKFTHHDLKFHKVWWKSDKRFGNWSGQTDGQTGQFIYTPLNYVCGGYNKLERSEAKGHSHYKSYHSYQARFQKHWNCKMLLNCRTLRETTPLKRPPFHCRRCGFIIADYCIKV